MKTRTAASKPRSAGITLTEILISILGVGLVSLATLFPTVSRAGANRDDSSDDRDSGNPLRASPQGRSGRVFFFGRG
jgi:hypothetical protein